MKKFILALLIFFTGAAAISTSEAYFSVRLANKILEQKPTSNKKIRQKNHTTWTYIIAAHPDDEILCCAETIAGFKKQKKPVKIVFITDGDGLTAKNWTHSKQYGVTRRQESIAAAQRLGVWQNDLIFLNFPDNQLARLGGEPIRSFYTGQTTTNETSTFPNTPYTKKNLLKNLTNIFTKFPPSTVYIPTQLDKHPDHRLAGRFAKSALINFPRVKLLGYTVHGKTDGVRSKKRAIWKQNLIDIFESQFHDKAHEEYLKRFAHWKEEFIEL